LLARFLGAALSVSDGCFFGFLGVSSSAASAFFLGSFGAFSAFSAGCFFSSLSAAASFFLGFDSAFFHPAPALIFSLSSQVVRLTFALHAGSGLQPEPECFGGDENTGLVRLTEPAGQLLQIFQKFFNGCAGAFDNLVQRSFLDVLRMKRNGDLMFVFHVNLVTAFLPKAGKAHMFQGGCYLFRRQRGKESAHKLTRISAKWT
jgi:hypothetical protein